MTHENVIEMREITKIFGEFVANDKINLELRKGEIHALLGENEEFAEAWYNENPEMFDALNDFELMMFLEEHDPSDKQGFINFLTPYCERAKQLANIERDI